PGNWLQRGRTYPTIDTPTSVLTARKKYLAIPPHGMDLLPSKAISVSGLLNFALPSQQSTLLAPHVQDAFSREMPNE
ncbi:hypothetical protein BC629DRAFT_1259116, partial [Irpex lacteus]